MKETVLTCLYEAIDEANQGRGELPDLAKTPETPIHGSADGLDSLGLINFIVAVEENVEREFGEPVMLSDDRVLSEEPSPLRSIGALSEYISAELERRGRGVERGS